MIDKELDISKFEWTGSEIRQSAKKKLGCRRQSKPKPFSALPKPGPGDKFIRGPIPLDWILTAVPCGRKSLNVAMAVWYLAGFKRQNQIKLTATTLAMFDTTPQTARRILVQFELAGLVTVDRKRGRSPIVTIHPAYAGQDQNSDT